MCEDLVIIGAGGFAREASLLVEEINEYGPDNLNLLGFVDDDPGKWGFNQRGYPVLGGFEVFDSLSHDVYTICVVSEPAAKKKLVKRAVDKKRQFINLIHPGVSLNGGVTLGSGVLINKGTILTTNIFIGDYVLINPGCGIGHDSVIGSFSTLMWRVNISGSVKVGEGSMIGTGATLLQGISLGDNCQVGAGAVVTKNQPGDVKLVGIPARSMEQ